ncbi:MAG: hypothetical protein V4466_10355 [Pseudomonadota bacterium]
MKTKLIAATAAGVMALAAGAAIAQSNPPGWDEYQSQQRDYQRQQSAYQDRREDYDAQRRAYEAKRDQYLRDQDAYDRRYGRGAYVRQYGEWRYDPYVVDARVDRPRGADYQARHDRWLRDQRAYDRRYGRGAYVRKYGDWRYEPARGAEGYGRDTSYYDNSYYSAYRDSPCESNKDGRTAAGAIIGALAGAAIGSNVAAGGVRTEGAVLGALVGGGLGGSIGRSTAKCDDTGYWYSRDQTISYREANREGRGYASNDYSRRGCRLAAAPTEYGGRTDYRYVRVCPDSRGRYRITG